MYELREIRLKGLSACFTVQTADKPVHMCIRQTPYGTENQVVVIVDAERFLSLWRANPNDIHHGVAGLDPEGWRKDRKYQRAADGFSLGHDDPVPLADASCWIQRVEKPRTSSVLQVFRKPTIEEVTCVALTNGVTRTIWLLANGCQAFPIMCHKSGGAQLLHELAGVPGIPLRTVAELFSPSTIRS